MNHTDQNLPPAPRHLTPEQADHFIKLNEHKIELVDKAQVELLIQVQRKMGELIYDELLFGVGSYLEDTGETDLKAAFKNTIDGMISEIQGSPLDLDSDCGTLFAKLWEQFVRLHPQLEPWPEATQAARWRRIEGEA